MHGQRTASWRRHILCYMGAPMEWRKTHISQLSLVPILPGLGNIRFQCTNMGIKCLVLEPSYISSSVEGCSSITAIQANYFLTCSKILENELVFSCQDKLVFHRAKLWVIIKAACVILTLHRRHKRRRKSHQCTDFLLEVLGLRPKTLMPPRYLTMRNYRNFWPYGWNVLFSNDWIPVRALEPCMCLEVLHTSFQTPEPTPPQSVARVLKF